MPKPDGGQAFPSTEYYDEKPIGSISGMSLRDWFAGHAPTVNPACLDMETQRTGESQAQIIARLHFEYADAMLAERERE